MRVLLVDDAEDFTTYTRKRLLLRGLQAIVAGSGEKALAVLEKENVDVAVLDVLMPGMDGVELLVEIKKRYPRLPVIMLTGHGTVETAREGLEKGAREYLLKPCDFDTLLGSIRKAYETVAERVGGE
jgi:DNA-binding NtrC family response regulator